MDNYLISKLHRNLETMEEIHSTPLYIRRERVCRGHPNGKTVGTVDGVKIIFCPICGGARLKRISGPWVRSILTMAEICYSYVPKHPEIRSDGVEFVIRKAREVGLHPDTARHALEWVCKAGGEYKVSPNGILTELYERIDGERIVKALTRLRDELGDPPLLWTEFECPTCGKVWEISDVPDGECFSCTDCISWYLDTGSGVKRIEHPIGRYDYATLSGIVRDRETGEPIADAEVKLNKRQTITNSGGEFGFSFTPFARYTLKVNRPGYHLYTDTLEISSSTQPRLKISLERFDLVKDVVAPVAIVVAITSPIWSPPLWRWLKGFFSGFGKL